MNPQREAAWELHQFLSEKVAAGRPQDVADIEGVVYRQQDALDVRYIRLWLCEFAALLEQPERVEMFEKPWRELHSTQKGQ